MPFPSQSGRLLLHGLLDVRGRAFILFLCPIGPRVALRLLCHLPCLPDMRGVPDRQLALFKVQGCMFVP